MMADINNKKIKILGKFNNELGKYIIKFSCEKCKTISVSRASIKISTRNAVCWKCRGEKSRIEKLNKRKIIRIKQEKRQAILEDMSKNYREKGGRFFADKYGVSIKTISQYAFNHRLCKKRVNLESQKNGIIKDYNSGFSVKNLQKKYGHDSQNIKRFLIKNGCKFRNKSESHRRFYFNENYFQLIDTAEKAYWLGFLYADGNIYQNKLQICLAQKDTDALKALKKATESEHKLYWDKNCNCYRFTIHSDKLTNDLIKLGCIKKKSLILKFPTKEQVPKRFISSFMLGIFDGDGCIQTWKKGKRWRFEIISTKEFCRSYQKVLINELNFTKTKIKKEKRLDKDTNVYYLIYGGSFKREKEAKKKFINLFNFLYRGKHFCLKRKKNKFLNILK